MKKTPILGSKKREDKTLTKKIKNVFSEKGLKSFVELQSKMISNQRKIHEVTPGSLWISKSKNLNGNYDIVFVLKRSIDSRIPNVFIGEYWCVIKNGLNENFFWEGDLYNEYDLAKNHFSIQT